MYRDAPTKGTHHVYMASYPLMRLMRSIGAPIVSVVYAPPGGLGSAQKNMVADVCDIFLFWGEAVGFWTYQVHSEVFQATPDSEQPNPDLF